MAAARRRALISVSDKSGLEAFVRGLAASGIDLVSTGGTAKLIAGYGLAVTEVAEVTGFPEIMDGRVKTLHPRIHGGILALRGEPGHESALAAHGIAPIELVVVNLYPFEAARARGAGFAEMVETIDIGGPAMIRAAAKNHAHVTVVVDPDDYSEVLAHLDTTGEALAAFRRRLARRAFARTAAYDTMIAGWLDPETSLGPDLTVGGARIAALRYGENPHQKAALYLSAEQRAGVVSARQIQGKALSYNNIADTDAAYECVAEFDPADQAACVIVKHANPCGAAAAAGLKDAYARALACDPVSAFGGILAFNRSLDPETAAEAVKLFTEVIIAPDAEPEALAILGAKPNLRVLLAGALPDARAPGRWVRSVAGGLLAQTRDSVSIGADHVRVVTKRQPSAGEMRDLVFAARIAKHVKSNAIVYAKDGATVGIGAGQMSRIDAALIGARKAEDAARAAGLAEPLSQGSAAASEAFFPFADGLEAVARAGARAVIQPGGSRNDAEVIAAADALGLAMVFTGIRQFRH